MTEYILFDTETTGLEKEDRIIQLGCMIINSKTDIKCFCDLCATNVAINLEAMETHHITPDLLEGKPICIQTDAFKKMLELNLPSNYLIAHNINFDLEMLKKEAFENQYTLIDTLRCSKHLFPELKSHRLQYLRYALELYKIENEEATRLGIELKAHDALGDVLITKLFLSKLVERCRAMHSGCNPMKKLAELTQTLVMEKTFSFGKYKGKNITEIAETDLGYLQWMQKAMQDISEDMKYTLNTFLN